MRFSFFRKSKRSLKKLYSKNRKVEKVFKSKNVLVTNNVSNSDDMDGDSSGYGYDEVPDIDESSDYGYEGGNYSDYSDYSDYGSDNGDYGYDSRSGGIENCSASRQSTEKEKLIEIKGALSEFKMYLSSSTAGPNKSATETNTTVGRIAKFLIWSFILTHYVPIEVFNTIPFVFEIICERFALVGQYVEFLTDSKSMKPSTLLQFLANVKSLVIWYTIFRNDCEIEYIVPSLQKDRAQIILKQAASNLDKLNKRHISTIHTYENDIRDKKLPKEGIEIIRAAVFARLEWAEQQQRPMEKATYDMFMGLLIVSFFVFSVQGRISGISDMKVTLNCNAL